MFFSALGVVNKIKHRFLILQGFGQRHLFATLGFLGLATVYMMRVNLSVAIVDMVNSTRTLEENGTEGTCPFPDGPAGETKLVVCLSCSLFYNDWIRMLYSSDVGCFTILDLY